MTSDFISAGKRVTPMLAYSCFCLLIGDALFGYDTGSFGGVLGQPGFIDQFGTLSHAGKRVITPTMQSLMNSLAFPGKFIGCLLAGPFIERWGHKKVFYGLSALSIIGIIIEITSAGWGEGAGRPAQLIVGRIVVYASVGLVEVCITTYQSEIVPGPLRGFVVNSMQMFVAAGGLIASGINRGYRNDTKGVGWRVVIGVQFIFPLLLLACIPLMPDSPRWLLSKDRYEDAISAMKTLRPNDDAISGRCEAEVQGIKDALEVHVHKSGWASIFSRHTTSNLRRTSLVLVGFTYQMITGQAAVGNYAVIFYKANGYAAQAFTYPLVTSGLGFVCIFVGMIMVETMGRRKLLILSNALQALWLFLFAGFGSKKNKTQSEKNAIVAFFMLFGISQSIGAAPTCYVLATELPNGAVREKTASFGAAINVFWAFVTNFIVPYMIPALSFNIGWIFGGVAVSGVLIWFFFLPETKGLALEEIDGLFEIPFNPFKPPKVEELRSAAARNIGYIERDMGGDIAKPEMEQPHDKLESV